MKMLMMPLLKKGINSQCFTDLIFNAICDSSCDKLQLKKKVLGFRPFVDILKSPPSQNKIF